MQFQLLERSPRPLAAALQASLIVALIIGASASSLFAAEWPKLPAKDGAVEIPAQEYPLKPGPRTVRVLVHYPAGTLDSVTAETGIMLTLHNWGGTDCVGTASPQVLAKELNVVALCVNYLQSGKESIDGPEPYDYGYLQALDALRALWLVYNGLDAQGRKFDAGRIYATGGSGGGNVTLMAGKLAPRTFACAIDICGMKQLGDDVAYNLPGGPNLDARYSRDPNSRNYLRVDDQELRFVGHPAHLAAMKQNGNACKLLTVHGNEDRSCPFADAVEMVDFLRSAELDIEPHFVTSENIKGSIFQSPGHSLGDRTKIVLTLAGKYLKPDGAEKRARKTPSDFEARDEVRYDTSGGAFIISYKDGYPVGRFEPASAPPVYKDRQNLTYVLDADGARRDVKTIRDWEQRRRHILAGVQQVMGPLPSVARRVPLDVKVEEETKIGEIIRRKISYQSDANDRVPAWLFIPPGERPRPAVLCLHQTNAFGKDEPAASRGESIMPYALELAERGYVTIVPDYPGFGEHKYDFAAERGYVSGSMKAIWDNIRAVDLLQALPEVDGGRIGCIGHSLGGHNVIFTALFDPRLKAIASSCGFTRFHKDDLPSWTGKTYMPKIASEFGNSADRMPFDFPELIAALAPRAFITCSAEGDSDFDVSGIRDSIQSAQPIYELYKQPGKLAAHYPKGPHAFTKDSREVAYKFLDANLKEK